ncbi:MAG: YceI family protein [Saprospiraceae bacterium]
MKNFSIFATLLAVFAFSTFSFTTEPTVKKVSSTESQIIWKGYKVTGSHTGTIDIKDGSLEFDGETLTGGNFVIDMSTLKTTDLTGKSAQKLEGHLKSADFFGIENYPSANFAITNVVSRGTVGEYKIIGNLTIKETTNPIKFNAVVKRDAGKNIATANITIDRSDYDIRYGSGSFFDNLGDKTIYDEFELEVKLVTK